MPVLANRNDPALIFKFYLEIEGVIVAEFTELSGLSVEREVKEHREGGLNDFVHRLPGPIKSGNITLKRGMTYSHDLWEWFHTGMYDGKVKRVNLSIILGDALGKRVRQWDLTGAYPVKYSSADLRSASDELVVETLELTHHGLIINSKANPPLA
jgi:phage tail-like protein